MLFYGLSKTMWYMLLLRGSHTSTGILLRAAKSRKPNQLSLLVIISSKASISLSSSWIECISSSLVAVYFHSRSYWTALYCYRDSNLSKVFQVKQLQVTLKTDRRQTENRPRPHQNHTKTRPRPQTQQGNLSQVFGVAGNLIWLILETENGKTGTSWDNRRKLNHRR